MFFKNEQMIQGEFHTRVKSLGESYNLDNEQLILLENLIQQYHLEEKNINKATDGSDETESELKSALGIPQANVNIFVRGFVMDMFSIAIIKGLFTEGGVGMVDFCLQLKRNVRLISNEEACLFKKIFQHETYGLPFKVTDVEKWYFSNCNNEHRYWKCNFIDKSQQSATCTFKLDTIESILNELVTKKVLSYSKTMKYYTLLW